MTSAPPRRGARTFCATLLLLAAAACGRSGDDDAPAPPAPGVVLAFDGIRITRAEIDAVDRYLEGLDSTMGRKYRTRELLDRFLIPLKLARRELADQRAELRAAAEALHAVAQNYAELRQRGALAGGTEPEEGFARNDLPFPVAEWAFAPEHLLETSPPIETPQGFAVIAARDIRPGVTAVTDRSMAFLVAFRTHSDAEFDEWFATRKPALRAELTYVAPELEDSLPRWLMP